MKPLLLFLFALSPIFTYGQFGLNFHQSNIPFIGVNYEISGKIRPELRIGIDNYLEDIPIEGVVTYDIINKEDYEFYGGIGIRSTNFEGVVIPVGVNFYPFTSKKLGFHIEAAPIFSESTVLRGSWGIRFRFLK